MKSLISFLIALAFAGSASATNLVCTTNAKVKYVSSFSLFNVESTKKVSSTFPDTSFFQSGANQDTYTVQFSNECDNMYAVMFNSQALNDVLEEKTTSLDVTVLYSNNGDDVEGTATGTCSAPVLTLIK
jgi:hypothetical protein